MKNLFFFIVFLFATANAFSQVYVSGYTRSNGTVVAGYYRTAPNATRNDNYSTIGNTNPYTGKAGTVRGDGYYNASSYIPLRSYSTPTYSTPITNYTSYNYSTPSSSSRTIYTGSRGGTYYINSNGNKSYVSRN